MPDSDLKGARSSKQFVSPEWLRALEKSCTYCGNWIGNRNPHIAKEQTSVVKLEILLLANREGRQQQSGKAVRESNEQTLVQEFQNVWCRVLIDATDFSPHRDPFLTPMPSGGLSRCMKTIGQQVEACQSPVLLGLRVVIGRPRRKGGGRLLVKRPYDTIRIAIAIWSWHAIRQRPHTQRSSNLIAEILMRRLSA